MTIQGDQAVPHPGGTISLGALVEHALSRSPDRCAYRFGGAALSCRRLQEAAQSTAADLSARGLAPGEPVAVHVAPSFELVVGICGVLIAGGCAVPVDPDLSEVRRQAILADIRPRWILCGPGDGGDAGGDATRVTVCLDGGAPSAGPALQPAPVDPASDLAFVVYTSGTTGGPKGVEITHASYVGRLQRIVETNPMSDSDVDLAWTPASFIGMLDEIFFPLLAGVPAVIAPAAVRSDARGFADLVAREAITRFRISPSLLRAFLRSGIQPRLRGLRAIYCSGETIPADLQRDVLDGLDATLIGFYGATEAPGIAYHEYRRGAPPLETTVATIQPFARMRVTRTDGTEAAQDEPGEIWVGGGPVARGYWNRPELTAEKFVETDGGRWYRTGDRGRRLDADRIEILGRTDLHEINVHGVRIDLREVRDALKRVPGIEEAWASAVERGAGRDPVMVGHCVMRGHAAFDPAAIRSQLTAMLPTLAVPRHLIAHDRMPLTGNGKLDAQQLAEAARDRVNAPADAPTRTGQRRAPASPAEGAVLQCMRRVLGTREIGPDDDFFGAGGTSLDAVALASLLSEWFGTRIGIGEVWLHPTVRELARHIGQSANGRTARSFVHIEGTSGPCLLAIGFGFSHLAGVWPGRRLFVSPGILGDPCVTFRRRLDSYVSEYLEGLRRVQPGGPYQLIGFSFSGLLAYELARCLKAEGEEVTGVAVIEPLTPMAEAPARSYARTVTAEIGRALAERKAERTRRLVGLAANSISGPWKGKIHSAAAGYGYLVMAAERLEPFDGAVDMICTSAFGDQRLDRWRSATDLRVRQVSGEDHSNLIKPDSLQEWKDVVDRWAC